MANRESDYSRPTVKRRAMRTGYTTGSCATAASKAAVQTLLTGEPVSQVTIHLPMGEDATFQMHRCEILDGGKVLCSVIKDGGDDPDATSGAEICSTVSLTEGGGDRVTLVGGPGLGIVTKPGIGIPVGDPSITRVPRRMITQAVIGTADGLGNSGAFLVEISVPGGEEIAKKTDNPRLGIVDGISILGTTGVVQPFSTAAWRASVNVSIDVAAANSLPQMVISTGTQSEAFTKHFLDLPDMAYVNVGIFTGSALKRCAQRGIGRATLVGMVGKFSKLAMGYFVTHVAGNKVDPEYLTSLAAECGVSPDVQAEMRQSTTARHFQEIAQAHEVMDVFDLICRKVCQESKIFVGERGSDLIIDSICFDFEGNILGQATTSDEPLLLKAKASASE
ncbi:MAG: cobalt-precorrin-5B (C(1))-methyltransferase [Chloroflexi bacterium]|nr:cobalt-precorrin-5B (C(1))-methyltransferase [Chloroflexota bacterium]MDA1228097.1 cobalt-precorrin-5B (C(1))-methyltransferase [Chloroflexota bacterium]